LYEIFFIDRNHTHASLGFTVRIFALWVRHGLPPHSQVVACGIWGERMSTIKTWKQLLNEKLKKKHE
jgi:lipoate-protein ligase B